jgi:hypothetical protein
MTQPQSPGTGSPTPSGFWAFWTTVPGVLTGVAALLTAIAGLAGLRHAVGGDSPAPPRSGGGIVPYISPSSGSHTSISIPTPPGSGTVLRQGQITMVADDKADLEQGLVGNAVDHTDLYFPTDPVVDAPTDPGGIYARDYPLLESGGGTTYLAATDGTPDQQHCREALAGRHDSSINLPHFPPGSWVCVLTSEGNVAAVRLVQFSHPPHQRLVLDYTVWQQ